MSRVQVTQHSLLVDGEECFIRAGEIHYFRTPKGQWSDRIAKAKAGNLNCISFYIPWFWHEPEEGQFDFNGKTCPERDLVAWLELIKAAQLYCIVRPGPFVNSELKYGGHPRWLFDNYPEVYSHRADGTRAFWVANGTPVPSQLHPVFLRKTFNWYEAVIPILAQYSIENGGPVILSQPDNEVNYLFTYGLDGSLYDEHVLGKTTSQESLWPKWLKEKYGSISVLNNFLGTSFRDFSDCQPPRKKPDHPSEMRLGLEWLRFKKWHLFHYAFILAQKMKELGLTVPFTLNEPVNYLWGYPWGPGDHAECSKAMIEYGEDGNCFTTGHVYPYSGDQDALGWPVTLYRFELLKSKSLKGPNFICELSASWCDLTRDRSMQNWNLLLKGLLGHGLEGYSVFMYSGGETPAGEGKLGRDYGWRAPIGKDGSVNEAYKYIASFNEFVEKWQRYLSPTRKQFEVTIGIFSELPLLGKFLEGRSDVGFQTEDQVNYDIISKPRHRELLENLVDLSTVLTDLNIHFQIVSLNVPNRLPGKDCKLLVVPNVGVLSAEGFAFIQSHLAAGGTVFFYPTVPTEDADGLSHPELSRLLEFRESRIVQIGGTGAGNIRFHTVNGRKVKEVAVDKHIHLFSPPKGADEFLWYGDKSETAGYVQQVGKGKVIVCGIYPHYLTEDGEALFREIFFEVAGLERSCWSEDERLHVVLRSSEASADEAGNSASLLTVMNVRGRESKTRLNVKVGEEILTFPKQSEIEIYPDAARSLWLNLDVGFSTIRYVTSEITPRKWEPDRLIEFDISGDMLTEGEIAFTKKVGVRLDGVPLELYPKDGLWIGVYQHGRFPRRLEVIKLGES